ncbi:aprataxin and PNK-like factor [Pelobates fuscus]|uniref:aprataxin and PNK-like factor n=1 Tax=Pelobates fuscus TaxID=191477 RepID=UPI002FE44503
MSAFQLEATDGSGSTVLPPGETLIGRGPLLGVTDKRVSRNHALLEVVDSKLRIKPVHLNPCFYLAAGKSSFIPLERNEWYWLNSSDCFSFLPDKYIFRVIEQCTEDEKQLRNEALSENCPLSKRSASSPAAPQTYEKSSCSTVDTSHKALFNADQELLAVTEEKTSVDQAPAEEYKGRDLKSSCAPRKRILPNWMLQGELEIKNLPFCVKKPGRKRETFSERKATASCNGGNSLGKNLSSRDAIGDDEQGSPKKKKIQLEVTSTTSPNRLQGNTNMETSNNDCMKSNLLHDRDMDNQESEDVEMSQPNEPQQGGSSSQFFKHSSNSKKSKEDDICQSTEEDACYDKADSSQEASKKRTRCIYAENCYRKNPAHFQEFSHPGDGDYCDEEDDSQDDRPECPYGTDCYRKNPQHKQEYKHTKPPGRRLRKRATKKGERALDDSDNEYDLEDSFIDDEEEDFDNTDEDSDWVPDSEDKGSEDVNLLLKEAKKFVKGKP